MLNIQFSEIVKNHAKSAKVGQQRLQEFYDQARRATVKPHRVQAESDIIRDTILLQTKPFLSKDIADELGYTTVAVNNNLYALQRNGVVEPTGVKVKLGGRGKPATEWALT